MITRTLKSIGQAVRHLNPVDVRREAARPVTIGLVASYGESLAAMEEFFAPAYLPQPRRVEALQCLIRTGEPGAPRRYDIEICEPGTAHSREAHVLDLANPLPTIREIAEEHSEFGLALARLFPPFRAEVGRQLVSKVCRENTFFCLATALPNITPSFLTLPWTVGEFASDTAFLTANQIRMAFLLAAANDRPVGYAEQKTEVGSIIAGAFGWRALARELVGKVPLGGGLIAKSAVAYAGTWVVGRSIERLYRLGCGYSKRERREEYASAYERGREVALALLESVTSRKA